MKPRRPLRRRRPPTAQLALPLPPRRVVVLDATTRGAVVPVLARLLAEAARPAPAAEDGHDGS